VEAWELSAEDELEAGVEAASGVDFAVVAVVEAVVAAAVVVAGA
jgi:hypothetical protein